MQAYAKERDAWRTEEGTISRDVAHTLLLWVFCEMSAHGSPE